MNPEIMNSEAQRYFRAMLSHTAMATGPLSEHDAIVVQALCLSSWLAEMLPLTYAVACEEVASVGRSIRKMSTAS
jgi:hypothetical protein